MNFLQSFNNKTILIPLLQRDYVQGGSEDVIGPFLDALIEKECDLTYIYGYEENGCFVPVDGQQRLTTLWLLHLYLFALNHLNVTSDKAIVYEDSTMGIQAGKNANVYTVARKETRFNLDQSMADAIVNDIYEFKKLVLSKKGS